MPGPETRSARRKEEDAEKHSEAAARKAETRCLAEAEAATVVAATSAPSKPAARKASRVADAGPKVIVAENGDDKRMEAAPAPGIEEPASPPPDMVDDEGIFAKIPARKLIIWLKLVGKEHKGLEELRRKANKDLSLEQLNASDLMLLCKENGIQNHLLKNDDMIKELLKKKKELVMQKVNLADTSATKEARIQEAEAKLNHCEATCNRITELERELSESSSSLRRSKERISELEQRVSKMEKELCSTKDAAAANEQRLGAELSTVMKLAELHKESSEEWSKKAGELEGVIKALETHLTQVEDEYKEKLEKETLSRIDLEKEADNLKQKLEKCELDLENTRKSSELSLVPFSSVAPDSADLRDSAMPISDTMNQNDLMIIPKVPSGVSGTALAASLLRDGWSLPKIYEKYQEATDALHHEWQGRRHAEAVLERVLHEIEEKAELILDERAEHERMVEAYALMDQKLQQALLEHDNFESTIRSLKSELKRRERDHSVAQKEIDDLQKEIAVLLKECQDIQLRCGSSLPNVGPGPLSARANDLSNAENNLKDSMSFKDINELVQQNVRLRNQVHILSADLDKKDMELRESFQIELKKIVDDAASRVEKVMKKSEEQAIMIESLHRSVAMYRKLDKKNAFDSCMKQVEDMRKELQNSCKAVSDAESRAAAAEARCSVLEAKLKSRKEIIKAGADAMLKTAIKLIGNQGSDDEKEE